MTDIQPNFAAVKQGLIPLTPQEKMKLDKDGLDVIHDIYRYAKTGFASIDADDFDRMKWYGVYRQKPKDSGYFMMRLRLPGGQVTAAQAAKLSEVADRFGLGFFGLKRTVNGVEERGYGVKVGGGLSSSPPAPP